MQRVICFVFIFVVLSIIHLGSCSASAPINSPVDESESSERDGVSLLPSSSTIVAVEPVAEEIVDTVTEPIVEEIADSVTEPVVEEIVDTVTQPIVEEIVDNVTEPTTTIRNEEPVKQFLTKYLLNVNLSSSLLSNVALNTYLNDSIVVVTVDEHEIVLINKQDGTVKKDFKDANIIPTNQQSNILVIFDDNTQELWIFDSIQQHSSKIPFKPKQIYILSSANNLWIAETSDDVALYISQNSGIDWKKIDDSSSSTILGWSIKANSVVIIQHSRYIKLLDITTYQITSILTDVSSTKLFSRYLFAKRSNTNDSITIGHVDYLIDHVFRSLPKRFQSQGNFYCAVEDINTQDLLLLFITDNKLGENNETISSTCNLMSYTRQNSFYLSNIDCGLINNNNNSLNTLQCPKEHLPFYQVHGLSKSVFLANIALGPTTVVSSDGGATWNKTNYECDKMTTCPRNVSIVINSLSSSNNAPGIIVGKASDGVNEYVAVSSDGGRLWRLSLKGNSYFTAISNPNALIVAVLNNNQQSMNHSFRYSTDYGRTWHQGSFANETSFRIISLIADHDNIFYLLTSNDESLLNLIQLDFNLHILEQCARHQVKEWSLHNSCINGSKLYYKRRIPSSHCLNNASEVRAEPCACSLVDYECLPGYKRSKDGICLPRSHYIYSQECSCNENSTLLTKRRGYAKSVDSQCTNGIDNYLSDAYVTRRDPNHPNFFLYGIDSRTKLSTVEIHTNDFDQNDEDEDEDDDEDLTKNTIWSVDQTYEITALVFNETGKQVYMAVEHDQLASIYRIGKNLRQQNRLTKQIIFDSNNELYKSKDDRIEYLTIDWSTQNLYVLVRNKISLLQTVFLLDIRTHKRRTIIKNQHIQPSILIVDPIKTELYWMTHNSPSVFNIGNLQGEIKKQIRLFPTDTNVTYMSYDPITHEIIFVANSNIYGLNTLNHHQLSPRILYEHSSIIQNALFVHPILYFTNDNNNANSSSIIHLNSIDILAKSFGKNIARFKDFDSLKLFIDMAPNMPTDTTTTINRCATNPCSDICIPLAHGRFRCLCNDNARYQTCSCPIDERFIAGACQAKNGQCAPGRVLCQNRLNCAESALVCEQDHTQYTEAFKETARCTLEKPNDGFDCYYTGSGRHNPNDTCIPFAWLCDGVSDCPLGNDEDHCLKMTTTTTKKSISKIEGRCLTGQKFTHVMCQNKCMKINDLCRKVTYASSCSDQFHLNCKQTHEKDQYDCKCLDDQKHCIAMAESCDDLEHCDQVCNTSLHYAASKTNDFFQPSTTKWIILIAAILIILLIVIAIITCRYMRRRKEAKKTPVPTRTPAEAAKTIDSPPTDAREKLLNNAPNTANETS